MTMYYNDGFDRLFKSMSGSFVNLDDIFEEFRESGNPVSGPVFYGCTMAIGPDGKPVVKEYGNVKPGLLQTTEKREPLVDILIDEKEREVKLVAEMPGVEKSDLKIVVDGKIVNIDAEHGEKKYHVQVPIQQKVDKDTAKANYKNGILELKFKLAEPEKPKGKTVEVE